MKPFNFRLERVLTYRKYLEKKALAGLCKVKNECDEKRESIKRVIEQRSKLADDRFAQGIKGVAVPRFQIYTSFLQKLNSDLESGHIEIRNTEQRVKSQEAVVRSEMIKRKALETLKGHRLQTYLYETGQEEQMLLDELAINKRRIRT